MSSVVIEGDSRAQRRRVPVEVRSRRTLIAQHATRKGRRAVNANRRAGRHALRCHRRDQRRGIGVGSRVAIVGCQRLCPVQGDVSDCVRRGLSCSADFEHCGATVSQARSGHRTGTGTQSRVARVCGKRIACGSGCQHRICTGSPSCIRLTDPAFRIALLSSRKHCPPFQTRNPNAGSPTIRSFDPFDPSSIPLDHRNVGAKIIGHRDPSVITVRTPAREVAIRYLLHAISALTLRLQCSIAPEDALRVCKVVTR